MQWTWQPIKTADENPVVRSIGERQTKDKLGGQLRHALAARLSHAQVHLAPRTSATSSQPAGYPVAEGLDAKSRTSPQPACPRCLLWGLGRCDSESDTTFVCLVDTKGMR